MRSVEAWGLESKRLTERVRAIRKKRRKEQNEDDSDGQDRLRGGNAGDNGAAAIPGFVRQGRSGRETGERGSLHLHDASLREISGSQGQVPNLFDGFGSGDEEGHSRGGRRPCGARRPDGTHARDAHTDFEYERDRATDRIHSASPTAATNRSNLRRGGKEAIYAYGPGRWHGGL